MSSVESDRPLPNLSPREQQLLRYAAEGLTDTAIANKLGISEATVGTYWGRVRIKLGPYSRTELVAIVLRAEREVAVEALRRENEHLVESLREHATLGDALVYHDLLENAPDAMLLVSADGTIEHANLAMRELFGYEHEGLVGSNLACLVPAHYRDRHDAHRHEFIYQPQRRQMGAHESTPALHRDGTEFPIRAALSSINTPSGMMIICAIRPAEDPVVA